MLVKELEACREVITLVSLVKIVVMAVVCFSEFVIDEMSPVNIVELDDDRVLVFNVLDGL